jgi:hypothetical protein
MKAIKVQGSKLAQHFMHELNCSAIYLGCKHQENAPKNIEEIT